MKINLFNTGLHVGAMLLFVLAHTMLTKVFPEVTIMVTYFVGIYALLRVFMKPLDKRYPALEKKTEQQNET